MRFGKGISWIAATVVSLTMVGCGGLKSTNGGSGVYTGLYRAALTRGTSTVSVSVDSNGNSNVVITDDASKFPSFTGSGTVTTVNGTGTLNASLTGSDGSIATAVGTFGASGSTTNLTLNISGGIGASGLVMNPITPSTVYAGSWTGNQTYIYTSGSTSTLPATATVTYSVALASDGVTLQLTGTGSTVDPTGNPATIAISGTIDPSGLYNETATYSYANSATTTAVSYSGYLNVDFTTGLSMVGSQTGNWPNAGPKETDTFTFSHVTGTAVKASTAKKR